MDHPTIFVQQQLHSAILHCSESMLLWLFTSVFNECIRQAEEAQRPLPLPPGPSRVATWSDSAMSFFFRLLPWVGNIVLKYNFVPNDDPYRDKKLSYRRETARQLPTWREGGVRPSSPLPSGYTYAYGWIRKPQRTYVKRAVRKAHFKMNRAFKVIQGHSFCNQSQTNKG